MVYGLELCCGFIVLMLAFLGLFYLVSMYNGLISLRNNIDKSWANIDVLLKQRSDLIPNLVEAVKGYMKHEKGVLEEIVRLRASIMGSSSHSEKAKPSELLSANLKSIFAISENYPKLRANENFLKLQSQLSDMENQIADRREFYNDSVLLYNTRVKSFPDVVIASILGMEAKEYFKATEKEKKVIKVTYE